MIKFLITLLVLLTLFIFLKKSKFFVNKNSINTIKSSNYGEIKKEYIIECKLNNEIIDRSVGIQKDNVIINVMKMILSELIQV